MATQVICGKCKRTLDYSGERPMFCSFCGNALGDSKTSAVVNDPDAATVAPSTMPGASMPPRPPAPAYVGGYQLLRELGSGGMGTVYEAEESGTGRHVALKLIGAAFTGSADAVERFRQEGKIAKMLTHPRCVFVIDTDKEEGRPYIVMELMEGSSLKDLVERHGPMSADDAIAKILDVIDGLQAAHRLEVIHRDMKPSNCFLEHDGRVKVGDFGLAKLLVNELHLTKTGAFVGTPHFASPEQVRGETIDRQTDVYSTAATLFFLLTGRPPFWGSDPTATLARIVADPVPSVREVRPELPAALDRVVRRGLERDRARRYADLAEFRQALLAVTPARLTPLGIALRTPAFIFDVGLLWMTAFLITRSVSRPPTGLDGVIQFGVFAGLFLLCFIVCESIWGASLGKALLGLRVCTLRWVEPPPMQMVLIRTLIMFGFSGLGLLLAALLQWSIGLSGWAELVLGWGWLAAGVALLALTMRPHNHYRGIHELASATRVTRLAAHVQRQALSGSGGWLLSFLGGRRLKPGMPQTLPERIAGFTIRGALKWSERDKVLLGEDADVGRRVFIWLRATSAEPLDAARRDVGRPTRLRWLASGRQGDWQWDAILAPHGCPLPEFIHSEGTLVWSEASKLLADLTKELIAACTDGTLPQSLSPALVWVQNDGRAQLADLALTIDTEDSQVTGGPAQQRALTLLRQAAALALDGRMLRLQETPAPLRAAVPPAAKVALNRLIGVGAMFASVEEFQNELMVSSS